MSKKHVRLNDDHQKSVVRLLRQVAGHRSLWEVWRDFVAIGALELSIPVDRSTAVERSAQYGEILKRYDDEERELLKECFAHLLCALEVGPCDFLGSLFMALELGNSNRGQYYTPFEVSLLVAHCTVGDLTATIERKGFVTVSDPCVGGGALLIAYADVLRQAGVNYQQCMHATAIDVDIVAVHILCYLQLSLLHMPAVVLHGDSLTLKMHSAWVTPAHVLGAWDRRQAEQARFDRLRELLFSAAAGEGAPVVVPAPASAAEQFLSQLADADLDVRGQLALF